MTRQLILVAAGGLARETLEALRAAGGLAAIGFVDDNPALWGVLLDGVKVLGSVDTVRDYPDAVILLCAGQGNARQSLAAKLDLDDSRYATVIHPSVLLPPSCTIGVGSILLAGCVLTTSVMVGRHVVAMPHVVLTHDDVVNDYATLCAGVTLGGSVHIGTRAYLGMNASVRENVSIGDNALIGMGSVVLDDVSGDERWAGVPARRLPRSSGLATA